MNGEKNAIGRHAQNNHGTPMVQFIDVGVRYGDLVALRDVTLDVFANQTTALIGASGAGKSVLVRSLIGLEEPYTGDIRFHGQSVIGLSEEAFIPIRRKIAYAFQLGALFDSMTVFDNLAYPLREQTSLSERQIYEKVINTLAKLGLNNTEHLFPANLSGGMQKRVGVARAMILNPELIIYDEPTTGLDPFNTRNINDLIIQLKKMGHTSIVITHDMNSAFYVADRIAMLYDGAIAYTGLTEDVKHSDNEIVKAFITGEQPEGASDMAKG